MMTRWWPKYTRFAKLCWTNAAVTLANIESVRVVARHRPDAQSSLRRLRNAQNNRVLASGKTSLEAVSQPKIARPLAEYPYNDDPDVELRPQMNSRGTTLYAPRMMYCSMISSTCWIGVLGTSTMSESLSQMLSAGTGRLA